MIATIIAAMAIAQTPVNKADGYRSIGMATWGSRTVLTLTSTAYYVPVSGTTPACFAHRSVVVVRAQGGEAACAWVDDSSGITFDDVVDDVQACDLSDASGYDGRGACWVMSAGERVDQTPWPLPVRMPGSRRTGVCTTQATAPGGSLVWVACDADADCTRAGAGSTCDTTLDGTDMRHLAEAGCSFLLCHGDTAGQYVAVSIEQ